MKEHVNMREPTCVRTHSCQDMCLRELCACKWSYVRVHMCVGNQEYNGAGTVVSSRGCGARSEAHTQVILELNRLRGVVLGNCVQRLWHHPAYESHH